jgi:hypothetical protein
MLAGASARCQLQTDSSDVAWLRRHPRKEKITPALFLLTEIAETCSLSVHACRFIHAKARPNGRLQLVLSLAPRLAPERTRSLAHYDSNNFIHRRAHHFRDRSAPGRSSFEQEKGNTEVQVGAQDRAGAGVEGRLVAGEWDVDSFRRLQIRQRPGDEGRNSNAQEAAETANESGDGRCAKEHSAGSHRRRGCEGRRAREKRDAASRAADRHTPVDARFVSGMNESRV